MNIEKIIRQIFEPPIIYKLNDNITIIGIIHFNKKVEQILLNIDPSIYPSIENAKLSQKKFIDNILNSSLEKTLIFEQNVDTWFYNNHIYKGENIYIMNDFKVEQKINKNDDSYNRSLYMKGYILSFNKYTKNIFVIIGKSHCVDIMNTMNTINEYYLIGKKEKKIPLTLEKNTIDIRKTTLIIVSVSVITSMTISIFIYNFIKHY